MSLIILFSVYQAWHGAGQGMIITKSNREDENKHEIVLWTRLITHVGISSQHHNLVEGSRTFNLFSIIEVWTDTIRIFHMELIFFIPSASNDVNIIPSSILPCSNWATGVEPTHPYKLRLCLATPSVVYLHRWLLRWDHLTYVSYLN